MENGGASLSRALPIVVAVALALLGGWVFFRSYGDRSRDECGEHYRSARNADDTARVDQIVLTNGSLNSCGVLRGLMSMNSDSGSVHAIATGIIDADNRRDLISVLSYYGDSAVLVPPGEPPVSGIKEIQRRYEMLFADWQPAIEPRIDSVVITGNTARVHGHNGGWLRTMAAGGTDRALDDTYIMTLERRGGTWNISRLQWTRNPP